MIIIKNNKLEAKYLESKKKLPIFAQNKLSIKKIILTIIAILTIVSCRNHVYHTYYKDIDVDTIPAIHDSDSSLYYVLEITELDSAQSKAMGLDGMIEIIFFIPSKDSYFFQLFGSDGGSSDRIYFNPESTQTFYNLKNHGRK